MIRFGLAGLGTHGARYAKHLLAGDVPGAALAAVSRSDERAGRAFAERHGLRFVRDPLELASLVGIDAIIAVLPPDLHPPVAIASIEAGRPVLVEKPLGADLPTAAAVAARARATAVPLMVAHTLRFDPLCRRLRDEARTLGPIRMIAVNQRFEPTDRPWIDTPGRGGAILNTGVHGFDLLRFMTDAEPVSVAAESRAIVTRDTEDVFAAIIRLEPGGILATVDNSRATRGRSGRVEVVCDDGQLRADHIHRGLDRLVGREITSLGPIPVAPTVVEALRAFVACLRDGAPVPVTAEDGVEAVRMADAVRLAVRLGRRVALEEVAG